MRFIPFFVLIIIFGCKNREGNVVPDQGEKQTTLDTTMKETIPAFVLNYIEKHFSGFSLPDTYEYNKAWWSFYDKKQVPYYVTTDINDDNIADYALLLKKSSSLKLVILTGSGDTLTHWVADDFKYEFAENNIEFGLKVQPPGRVDIVVENNDQSLILRSNGISLMEYEFIHKIYYWRDNKINIFLHKSYSY